MQQYPVPLFIETEALIFGPLTLFQFIILGIAGGIVLLVLIVTKSLLLTFGVGIIVGGPGAYLAFGKINGEKAPKILILAVKFFKNPKIFFWRKAGKEEITLKEIQRIIEEKEKIVKMEVKESKLKKLAWEVETGKR